MTNYSFPRKFFKTSNKNVWKWTCNTSKLHKSFRTQIIASRPVLEIQVAACVFDSSTTSLTTRNPHHPLGLQTPSPFSKPCHALRGKQAPGSGVSYSSQAHLHSFVPAWYAHILSTVLAFYFSIGYYFTFKVGHQWRTEHHFCLPIP